ncbi:MAG: ABC transporter permease subunit [Planctomycetota bacterium]
MSGTLVVARRELFGLFTAPFTWIVLVVVLGLNGMLFNAVLAGTNGSIMDALSNVMAGPLFWLWMVVLPALLAMRLIAEESRTGTLEYLLTAPVGDAAVVTGKFLAAAGFLALLWTSALLYAGAVSSVGGAPDWPAVLGTWLGAILVSSMFVAIGLFASTFTSTPLLAAFLAMVACVLWLALPVLIGEVLGYVVPLIARTEDARQLVYERASAVLTNMDASTHFERSFKKGIFDTSEVVFFLTWTALFLFLTARSLEARRWRG